MWTRGSRQPVWFLSQAQEGGRWLFCVSGLKIAVAAVVGILDVLKVVLEKSEVEVLGIGRGEEEGRERLGEAELSEGA